jgi:predicted membrane-bound mannosyltransferase
MATEQKSIGAGPSGWLGLISRRLRGAPRSAANGEEGERLGLSVAWWELAGYGSLLLAAIVMRLWDLGARAMHHDESLHALYAWNLSTGRGYEHNPMMHGPFQFEANAALFFTFGDSDFTARLLYALVGTALVAMPFMFRSRLGRRGALFTAALLTVSPAMLYFSRFARNDILMAAWSLGLVISMWRYIDEGRTRYLYISAALLALALATKETSYLLIATLGLFLVLHTGLPALVRILRPVQIEGVSPPVAAGRVIRAIRNAYSEGFELSKVSRPASYLVLLITLTLPQWSAFVSFFQNTSLLGWTNLVLAAPDGSAFIGAPLGGGKVIAFLIVVTLLGVSAIAGYKWNWAVWWRSALVFYTIWLLLYTTFLTNFFGGIRSGIWQSLGYWVVQQDTARGAQPWYYYFVLTSIYEYLAVFVGVVAAGYYLRRRDKFSLFLVYWPIMTFILYSSASEKMPWLVLNVTLPFIVLGGKFLGHLLDQVDWRRMAGAEGPLLVAGLPLFVLLLWQLAFFEPAQRAALDIILPVALAVVLTAMAATGFYLAKRVGRRSFIAASMLVSVGILTVLTVRTGWIASYQNGDTPVEMIVYTQTSPDVTRLMDTFKESVAGRQVPVSIDQTSGFSWPWAWYLRTETNVSFTLYSPDSFAANPNAQVVLVHSQNRAAADESLQDAYTEAERIRHRWWFPESTYRGLTPGKFLSGVFDRRAWRRAMDYWLRRDGVEDRIGSEDSYVYFRTDFPQNFTGGR